jgi:serine/threonine-protein kinase
VVLYEMLTGEVPFTAETVVGVAMKHVNEPMPDVQKRRPEISSALAAVVERSTAKDPKKRYPDMASCLADLEAALEVEVARAGGSHGQATTVLGTVPSKRKFLTTRRVSAAGVFLVLAATVAALLITALTGSKHNPPPSPAATGAPVEVTGTQSFDPSPGDGEEHDEELQLAIDGNPGTGWTTETYDSSTTEAAVGKPGVGLVVSTSEPVAARSMRIRSEVAGWNTQIYASATGPPTTLQGWGKPIGSGTDMNTDQTVELTPRTAKYYLIWITKLASTPDGYNVQINEVGLKS